VCEPSRIRRFRAACDTIAYPAQPVVVLGNFHPGWLKRNPRFHVYFTPTSASWLNMVERFFRDLTQNRLRRGVFRDVEELIMSIEAYIDRHNEDPKPFIWTAKANDILEKVKRARKALNNVQSV